MATHHHLLCQGPGPLYIKAFALRGTLYTLISKVDEAVKDLTQVIDAGDKESSTKVHCYVLDHVTFLSFLILTAFKFILY